MAEVEAEATQGLAGNGLAEPEQRYFFGLRSWARVRQGFLSEAESDARQALVGGAQLVKDPPSAIAVNTLAELAHLRGDPQRAVELTRAGLAERGPQGGMRFPEQYPLAIWQGLALLDLDQTEEAMQVLRDGLAGVDRTVFALQAPLFHGAIAWAHFLGGRWDDAVTEIWSGLDHSRRTAAGVDRNTERLLAIIRLLRGERDAMQQAGRLLEALHAEDGRLGLSDLRLRSLLLELGGDPERAAISLRQAWDLGERAGIRHLVAWMVPDVLRLARLSPSSEPAPAIVGPLVPAVQDLSRRWNSTTVTAAACLARGVRDGNAASLARAVRLYRSSPRRTDRAFGLEECAFAMLALGHPEQALGPLREALDIYLSVRAMPSVERVASEISHLGGREVRGRRGKPRHGLSSLTATEARVAELVATGVSNTEIAQRMALSRRTVAAYVANILSKLRLQSRTELIQLARRAWSTR